MSENLNWQQACRLLECSKSHFYNLVNSGEIPAQRFGKIRGIRVRKSDCQEYLEKSQKKLPENTDK